MAMLRDQKELSVGVVVFGNAMALDFVGPVSYLELLRKVGVRVTFHTLSFARGVVSHEGRMPLFASSSFTEAPADLDILLVPGGSGRHAVLEDRAFLDYLKRAADRVHGIVDSGGARAAGRQKGDD